MNRKEDHNFTTRIGVIAIFSLVFMVFLGDIKGDKPREIVQSTPIVEAKEIPEEVLPTPILTQREEIEKYIEEKFGEHSDKAMRLLTDPECPENRYLDPKAENNNYEWGGVGRDCGVFQVNDYYHPYTCEEMKDWKLNIGYAYRMFENDDYTFARWTCGKVLGI